MSLLRWRHFIRQCKWFFLFLATKLMSGPGNKMFTSFLVTLLLWDRLQVQNWYNKLDSISKLISFLVKTGLNPDLKTGSIIQYLIQLHFILGFILFVIFLGDYDLFVLFHCTTLVQEPHEFLALISLYMVFIKHSSWYRFPLCHLHFPE